MEVPARKLAPRTMARAERVWSTAAGRMRQVESFHVETFLQPAGYVKARALCSEVCGPNVEVPARKLAPRTMASAERVWSTAAGRMRKVESFHVETFLQPAGYVKASTLCSEVCGLNVEVPARKLAPRTMARAERAWSTAARRMRKVESFHVESLRSQFVKRVLNSAKGIDPLLRTKGSK